MLLFSSLADVRSMAARVWAEAGPTCMGMSIYGVYLVSQAILTVMLPGLKVEGLPVPTEGNRSLWYHCSGVSVWYVSLVLAAFLHYFNIFRLTLIVEHAGPIMTAAIIYSDVGSLLIYLTALATNNTTRMSGNHVYDFFMGAWLNPRIGDFDIKMFFEVRVSWTQLFLLTVACALTQYERTGAISNSMILMLGN